MEYFKEFKEIVQKRHTKGVSRQHWWALLFTRRVSIYITWLIVRYTNISANQVTIWQLIASLAGIACLCFSDARIAITGLLFLHLGYIFDNVDGEVARYRKSQSINGMFLDFVNHEVIIPMVFACLAFHYYFLTNLPPYFGLGLAIIILRINPVGKARHSTINYLLEKRRSPSYDITTYQTYHKSGSGLAFAVDENAETGKGTLGRFRRFFSECIEYPNDVIILSAVVMFELISGIILPGIIFLCTLLAFLFAQFVLSLWWHLKKRVPEREFNNYLQASMEIIERIRDLSNTSQGKKPSK